MPVTLPEIVASLELLLAAVGAVLLWRIVIQPRTRGLHSPVRLLPWNAPITDFFTFIFLVVTGSFAAALSASQLAPLLSLRGDEVTVFTGSAAQLGMLGGILIHRLFGAPPNASPPPPLGTGIFVSGLVTFLVSLPVLIATAKAWELFLEICGLPTEKQDLIGMFRNAESAWMMFIMITLAVVIAPLTEELVFRAGLFRYFRTRMPHWVALLAPAMIFAVLHVNPKTLQGLSSFAPLTVLAMLFSLGYERTGRIGTPIVAHALFNLNTIILIFSGVGV